MWAVHSGPPINPAGCRADLENCTPGTPPVLFERLYGHQQRRRHAWMRILKRGHRVGPDVSAYIISRTSSQTVNALRLHFRNWVMKGIPPPPCRYPRLALGTLSQAHKEALGFPTLPGLRVTVPEPEFIMPVHDYDWGPQFNAQDGSGVPSVAPPRIKRVLKMIAPKVDAYGNELGGVPVVLLDAPLGTYLGWNITATGESPFHKDPISNYVGGTIPFARTAEERKAGNDPRLSLQERYGSHDGYVAAVKKAAARACRRLLAGS